jgi:hypothetical protein
LVVVDKLSKYVRLIPTTTTVTAPGAAQLFVDHVFRFFGMPSVIISDRDPKFTSMFWQAFFKALGTSLAMSTAHHQQTNGQTERMNEVVETTLRAYVNHRQDDWDTHLTMVEFSINNSVQSSTGHTPFFLNFGRHPRTPSTMLAGDDSPVHSVQEMLESLSSLNNSAKDHLLRAQQRQSSSTDAHRRDVKFNVGDQVLINASVLGSDYNNDRAAAKLKTKWLGPFPVTAVDKRTVTVTLPPTSRAWNVFHVCEVKHYNSPVDPSNPRPPPDFVDESTGDMHYVVEKIINKRVKGRGRSARIEYLVKWEGYPEHESTWQGLKDLEDARDLVQEYEDQVLSEGM